MKCPQCKGYQLEPKEIESGLIAGSCVKCEGSLLSLMNYRFWADQHIEVEAVDDGEVIAEDCAGAKACPKCGRLMTKFQIGGESGNKIELCTGCDEAWLDKGEWQLLKKLDVHDKLPKIFTDAWQRNIRIERQEKKLKARYQYKLGVEDFDKVDGFKQWLDQHPEKSEIKQYLITAVI
jgi:Zn-finger nucleic acid-binding protein